MQKWGVACRCRGRRGAGRPFRYLLLPLIPSHAPPSTLPTQQLAVGVAARGRAKDACLAVCLEPRTSRRGRRPSVATSRPCRGWSGRMPAWCTGSIRTCAPLRPARPPAGPCPASAHPPSPAPPPALSACAAAAERRRVAAPHAAPPRARGRSCTTTRRSTWPPRTATRRASRGCSRRAPRSTPRMYVWARRGVAWAGRRSGRRVHALGTARACARDGAGRACAASARAGACAARPAAPPSARRPSSSRLVARRTLVALRRALGSRL